jgi:hypothetical protein
MVQSAQRRASEPREGSAAAALFLPYAAAGEAVARRYARRGLLVSSDGIVVRNLLTTQTIALDDAQRFTPGVRGGLNGPRPMLTCRTRASVGAGGLAIAPPSWRYERALGDLEPACEQLSLRGGGRRVGPVGVLELLEEAGRLLLL